MTTMKHALILAALLSTSAMATQQHKPKPPAKPAITQSQHQRITNDTRAAAEAHAAALAIGAGGSVGDIAGSTAVGTVETNTRIRPPAYAPSINPTANCAMGSSIGVGGVFSAGGSHIDANCARLEKAKALAALGDLSTAEEVLCADDEIRAARKRAGRACVEPVVNAGEPSDPYVRARLRLPAL